jgi:prepilin signal peptidase PulO-like enzyme (type II secretory pathway)
MADIHLVPGLPGTAPASPSARAAPTWHRVVRAWRALDPQRRLLVVVAAAVAIGAAVVAALSAPAASAIAIGVVGLLAGAAAVVDLHEQRLPNRLLSLCLVVVIVAAAAEGGRTLVDVAISLLMAALPLWIVRFGKGLAFGDVKFAAVLGAATGLLHPFAGLVVVWSAALAAGVFALRTGRHRLAFGPWLWAGYLTASLAAVAVVHLVLDPGGHTWPARP